MGEQLSDGQKSVIKFDSPFHSHSSEGDTHSQHERVDLSEIQSQINSYAFSESVNQFSTGSEQPSSAANPEEIK
jgi:hypothetical protein